MLAEIILTDNQISSWLAFFGVALTAALTFIAAMANRGRQHAKAARDQVENSHTSNLREEQDDRHKEVMDAIGGMRRDIGRLASADLQAHGDIQQLRAEFAQHVVWSQGQVGRIDDIEHTQPPRSKE